MDPIIVAAVIGALAVVAAALIGLILKRRQRSAPDRVVIACKLGYSLVQLSFYSMGRTFLLDIDEEEVLREHYRHTAEKTRLFARDLKLKYPSNISYDDPRNRELFGHFEICLHAFPKGYVEAYRIGRLIGAITLHILPNYLIFKTKDEKGYIKFEEMAKESFKSLEELWRVFFSKTDDLMSLSNIIKSISDRPLGMESITDLNMQLEEISQNLLDKFERKASKKTPGI